jgi:hypothetical protein
VADFPEREAFLILGEIISIWCFEILQRFGFYGIKICGKFMEDIVRRAEGRASKPSVCRAILRMNQVEQH